MAKISKAPQTIETHFTDALILPSRGRFSDAWHVFVRLAVDAYAFCTLMPTLELLSPMVGKTHIEEQFQLSRTGSMKSRQAGSKRSSVKGWNLRLHNSCLKLLKGRKSLICNDLFEI